MMPSGNILTFKPFGREREPRGKSRKAKGRAGKNRGRKLVLLEKPAPIAPPLILKELRSELIARILKIEDDRERVLHYLRLLRAEQELDIPKQLRDEIIARDKSVCCACGFNIANEEITIVYDLVPRRGGKHEARNLYAACLYCAANKGNWTIRQYREETSFPRGHDGAYITSLKERRD